MARSRLVEQPAKEREGALGRWSYRDRDLPLAGVNDRADATDKDVWTFRLGAAGRVEYLRNGELYYTSPVAPEFPLVPMVIFEGGSVLRAYMLEKDRGCTAEAEPFVSRAAFRPLGRTRFRPARRRARGPRA